MSVNESLERKKSIAYLFNRMANGQETMILEQSSFLVTETRCNGLTLLLSQHNTVEAIIDDVIVVEGA